MAKPPTVSPVYPESEHSEERTAPLRPGGRGAFVVVIGPDGAGKTSLARALLTQHDGPRAYFHFIPAVLTSLPPGPPENEAPQPPKTGTTGSRLIGCVRLARSFLRAWIAHMVRVRPAVRRGTLVVGDRWAYGYLAQPFALRFYGPRWLASAVIRALPTPDMVINLSAPPGVIRSRKQELTHEQIEMELVSWSSIPGRTLRTFVAIDGPESIARRVLTELER